MYTHTVSPEPGSPRVRLPHSGSQGVISLACSVL